MLGLTLLKLEILIIYTVFGDDVFRESHVLNPKIIVPKECETLRMNSFSSIILVPLLSDSDYLDMEWILFIRNDNNIWDYDIPPTPYTTIKQFKSNKKTDSQYFSTLLFDINDLDIPSFVHLSIRLIHKTNKLHNTSFDTASIIIRITDENVERETENIYNLYQNAEIHSNKMKNEYIELQRRYDSISKEYESLTMDRSSFPKQWNDEYLTDSFKNAINENNIFSILNPSHSQFVYKINNIFTNKFMNVMINEIKTAKVLLENGEIELFRPNSMNNDGFVLKELGLGPFFDVFMRKWISKVTSSIYPFYLWCGEYLDSIHGFTIRYENKLDRNLSRHLDQSQITFNLCLQNDDSLGTKVWFNGIRDDNINRMNENISISFKSNQALLHVGQHWHSTEDIKYGERINLILWFRSTYCINSISQYAFHLCTNFIPSQLITHTKHNEL